jgi:alpha-ketoglutarate-dependent 2,4-dichlorophenoxyacetate dioxygenase
MKPIVTPLHPRFVAKITEVDLSKTIGRDIQRAIEHAMDMYAVCVLPAQYLTDEQQIAFSCLYGPLDIQPVFTLNRRLEHREIFDVSNLDADGGILNENDARSAFMRGNQLWHTDSSFQQKSATWSMLHAKVIPPEGGDTEFADTRAAYDALPDAMKTRLEGLVAEHSLWHSRAKLGGYVPTEEERRSLPFARHKVVRRHPGSGRNALYIAAHASHIVGVPVEEGQALLNELIESRRRCSSSIATSGRLGIW